RDRAPDAEQAGRRAVAAGGGAAAAAGCVRLEGQRGRMVPCMARSPIAESRSPERSASRAAALFDEADGLGDRRVQVVVDEEVVVGAADLGLGDLALGLGEAALDRLLALALAAAQAFEEHVLRWRHDEDAHRLG